MKLRNVLFVLTFAAFMYCSSIFAGNSATQLATPWMTDSFISFEPNVEVANYNLRITTPEGESFQMVFEGSEAPYFQIQDFDYLNDGLYKYELVGSPILSNEAKAWMLEQRAAGMKVSHATLVELGFMGDTPMVLSGTFRIQQGLVFNPQNNVEEAFKVSSKTDLKEEQTTVGSPVVDQDESDRAQVYSTDLIVEGSECVGMDCTSSENFGYDTIRLKENNLRIKFDDTSASGSFPSNDWQLVANDTNNGGASYFAIQDVTDSNKTPFKVAAGAGNNALHVDSSGNVIIGSSSGNMKLNVQDGDTPAVRIYQDTSSGWGQQIWDVGGNETNFFVRDITNASGIPFKILPGADDDSLVIHGSDRVGVGTKTPSARLHVKSSNDDENIFYVNNAQSTATFATPLYVDAAGEVGVGTSTPSALLHVSTDTGSTAAVIEDTSASLADRNLLTLKNKGGSRLELVNTNLSDKTWQISNPNNADYLQFTLIGSGVAEMSIDEDGDLHANGNITAGGTITSTSDRNAKENFKPISHQDILSKVTNMEILEWNYIKDQDETRHIGPMAQDFHAAFGVGLDNKHISMVDMDGVALASIKALNEKVDAKDATIQELKAQNDALAEKLNRIEALLQRMEK